jgi:hypothetical protein
VAFINIAFHGFVEFDETGRHIPCINSATIIDGEDDSVRASWPICRSCTSLLMFVRLNEASGCVFLTQRSNHGCGASFGGSLAGWLRTKSLTVSLAPGCCFWHHARIKAIQSTSLILLYYTIGRNRTKNTCIHTKICTHVCKYLTTRTPLQSLALCTPCS